MDLKSMATKMLMQKLGGKADQDSASAALDALVEGDSQFDLGKIVNQFSGAGGDIASKAQSWLGDGKNDALSAQELESAIGGDKVAAFASKLGVDREAASGGLSDLLPMLIDKSSQGGKLMDSVGGTSGLLSSASKFFK